MPRIDNHKNKKHRNKKVARSKTSYQIRTGHFFQKNSAQLISNNKEIVRICQLLKDKLNINTSIRDMRTAEIKDPTYEKVTRSINKILKQ